MIYEVEYQYDEGVLPEERSVTVCQLHAEADLWASRYKLANAAYNLARELSDELEKWDCNYSRLIDAREKAERWKRAVDKIKSKYEQSKAAYENYFTELKVH